MIRLCGLPETAKLGIDEAWLVGLDPDYQRQQCGAIKLPLQESGVLVGQVFVQGQPEVDRFQVGKLVGRQHLPLDHRDVDLHVIEPTGVD
jgi:hypothetical protein